MELFPNVLSPFGPAGDLIVTPPALKTAVYKGTLLMGGLFYRFSDLVNMSIADTVLIQHLPGTGLIRIAPVTLPPIYYETFEGRTLGPLDGQDGWAYDATHTYGVPTVAATANVRGSRALAVPSANLATDLTWIRRAITPILVATFPYRLSVSFYMPDIATTDSCQVRLETAAGVLVCSLEIGSGNLGTQTCAVLDGAGAAVASPTMVSATRHALAITIDVAGNIIGAQVDGLPIATAAGVAGGWPDTIGIYSLSNDNVPLIGWFDEIKVEAVTAGAGVGLGLTDGASERLEAQLQPIDLTALGIMVDPAADADVEILVIGA